MNAPQSAASFRLPAKEVADLAELARETRQQPDEIVIEAVRDHLARRREYIAAVKEGLDAARRGDVVSHDVILADMAERRRKARAAS